MAGDITAAHDELSFAASYTDNLADERLWCLHTARRHPHRVSHRAYTSSFIQHSLSNTGTTSMLQATDY